MLFCCMSAVCMSERCCFLTMLDALFDLHLTKFSCRFNLFFLLSLCFFFVFFCFVLVILLFTLSVN